MIEGLVPCLATVRRVRGGLIVSRGVVRGQDTGQPTCSMRYQRRVICMLSLLAIIT
jgi:hypothetical protein